MSKQSNKAGEKTPSPIRQTPANPSKLGMLVSLLRQPRGATIAELASATGWQNHSVRGALAGTLKKKGHQISSEVVEGVRRYRIVEAQA